MIKIGQVKYLPSKFPSEKNSHFNTINREIDPTCSPQRFTGLKGMCRLVFKFAFAEFFYQLNFTSNHSSVLARAPLLVFITSRPLRNGNICYKQKPKRERNKIIHSEKMTPVHSGISRTRSIVQVPPD